MKNLQVLNILDKYNAIQKKKRKELRKRMSNYSAGRTLEYEIKSLFESAGWDVMRGSSSKGDVLGMKADLVASKFTDKIRRTAYMVLVQAKRQTLKGEHGGKN